MNNFDVLYVEEACGMEILQCKDCGTIIYTYVDDRYEKNFRCPVCTDYKTDFRYITKEDIEKYEQYQIEYNGIMEMSKIQKEMEERKRKRNGKRDCEIAIFNIGTTKISLCCDNITDSYFKGLRIKILFKGKTHFIPLSLGFFKEYRKCVKKHGKEVANLVW